MKTKLNQQQENNFKRLHKSIFIYFVILVALNSNFLIANGFTKAQNYSVGNSVGTAVTPASNPKTLKKPALSIESDAMVIMTESYKKTIEEIIAEDHKIIESELENKTTSTIENTIEKVIKEDNQIIESNINNEAFPLDFD